MNRVIFGDCRDTMRDLKAQGVRVQCCVTSPPYFGLRDYGHPGQIGLEKTPAEYVAALVDVFEGVRELLADDGVLWLNLGDSYAGYHGNKNSEVPTSSTNGWTNGYNENKRGDARPQDIGLKPKNLIGIPWRVAFALQADGWYLRSDIIWAKPNPMPESVTDRPTKAHEYVFLLTKSARYWYDLEAIREPISAGNNGTCAVVEKSGGTSFDGEGKPVQAKRKYSEIKGANARTVWTIATQPYSGAHFATFPPELARRCILAGCPPGATVLDPFAGSGTTGAVAIEEGREFTGIELNPAYCALAEKRLRGAQPPLFAEGGAA